MINFQQIIGSNTVFFISPDMKRGLGLEDKWENYHIICSEYDPLIPVMRKQGAKIFCLEEIDPGSGKVLNNSGKLLECRQVDGYINRNSVGKPYISYFKPSLKLDILIKKKGYAAIGNNALLNEEFENKIKFHSYLSKHLAEHAIPSVISELKDASFTEIAGKLGADLVIQFGHGWAGKTTYFIDNKKALDLLKEKFPRTVVRISRKISGLTVLNNCCVYLNSIYVGPAAVQISGIKLLHDNPAVTCGRQWPVSFIGKKEEREITNISVKVGKILAMSGYRGLFGLDFIVDSESGRIYISEINPRMTASTPFFTRLELKTGSVPLLAYHYASFLSHSLKTGGCNYPDGISGSQLTFREKYEGSEISKLEESGVYKTVNKSKTPVRSEYYPEKLGCDEFFFSRRKLTENSSKDTEKYRLESVDAVLKTPGNLKDWVMELIRK